jgi:uncharacterized protein (TIGR02598 family)
MYCAVKKITEKILGWLVPFDQRQRHGGNLAGFTLVEVVLAIGIVAFALLPLLGLVPMGLSRSQQAFDTTIQAQIVQQMTSQAQETNFSTLSQLNSNGLIYFDTYGNLTAVASPGGYMAAFSTPANTVLTTGTSSGAATSVTTTQLDTLTICILSTRTPGQPITNITSAAQLISASTTTTSPSYSYIHKYTVFVPNNGL